MGLRDALDNGQPEAVSVGAVRHVSAACLLERTQEPLDLVGSDRRSGVAYGDGGSSGRRYGRDLDCAGGGVVAQGVIDEVGDQPFDQCGVACGWGRNEGGGDPDASAFGFMSASGEHGVGDLGEVEVFPVFDSSLAGGQGEEGVDESFLVLAEVEGFFAGRPKVGGGCAGVAERDLEEGALAGQWGSQFV